MMGSRIFTLIYTRFRKATVKAVGWLNSRSYEALFLDLPEDFTPFVRQYMNGGITQKKLWQNYALLTGLQQPFINALKYSLEPIIKALTPQKKRIQGLELYCYRDLECYIKSAKLSEKLLLLETAERVRSRLRVEDWRRLIREELENATSGWRRALENIAEGAVKHSDNVVLYSGSMKPFKEYLEGRGFRVKSIYLQCYLRPPLDVLRNIFWMQGSDNVPDETIERYVRCHLRYLDYIILSENIDVAHTRWVLETQPTILRKLQPMIPQ